MKRKGLLAWIIIAVILIIDQLIKIHVKTTMSLGESVRVTNWFYITFIENNGMAWGMTFVNKLFLSVLRVVAVCAIGWFIWQVVRQKGRTVFVVCLSMVLAGSRWQHPRLDVLWTLFYGIHSLQRGLHSAIRLWIHKLPYGKGCGHVLFPYHSQHLAHMDAFGRW